MYSDQDKEGRTDGRSTKKVRRNDDVQNVKALKEHFGSV